MTAMTLDQAVHHVTTTNPIFKVGTADIRGIQYPVFENIPLHIRALMQASREAQDNGAAEYIVFEDERLTYDEFCRETNKLAHALEVNLGIRQGDPVAIAMHNCPEMVVLTAAIASIGAVIVFVNAWWTTQELDYALKDSQAKTIFADGMRVERLLPLVKDTDLQLIGVREGETLTDLCYSALRDAMTDDSWPTVNIHTDDDFAIMYSSGTTGQPKGVVQTYRGALSSVFTWLMQAVLAPLLDPPDADAPTPPRPAVLVVTPLFHVTASHSLFLLSIPAGAKFVMLPKWSAENAVNVIRDEEITRFMGVPTQSADLMAMARQMNEPLPTLDFLGAGGAKRPAAQVSELADLFPNAKIATGWGMTETNANGIGMSGVDYVARPGSAGKLYPPIQQLKFLDDDGQEVATGVLGEITVKSASNMRCYLNKPKATDEVFQGGWIRSGDLGRIDVDGFVTIVDRKKNIIIRGGENIACLDVEGAIHHHPAVAEACAFSVPDDRLGEIVGAAIQVKPGMSMTPDGLRNFLSDHIAHFKIPQHIWFQTDALPRGATDKIDRRVARTTCLAMLETQKDHP
ncbi:MAG: acyl--CoA ligase [Rhodobacteraceae bacterium]|nr:acyl--CoA ligase [Paracoccaceae bacterium]